MKFTIVWDVTPYTRSVIIQVLLFRRNLVSQSSGRKNVVQMIVIEVSEENITPMLRLKMVAISSTESIKKADKRSRSETQRQR
jgi:hypothetical protein